jgi:putative flavoprotein involved in K+ transport
MDRRSAETFGTVVVGGGQAGLVMGYYLRRAGEHFVILEADERVGDSWRCRYDSLRLFSRPRYASLPGLRIGVRDCPTRDEMADYLETYAARFELPVRTGTRVTRVSRDRDGFVVRTTAGELRANRVVVATGAHRLPVVPSYADDLDPSVRQLHSVHYKNPDQFAPGAVLVVGAGNSGTDVALEAVRTHLTYLAGRHPGQVPVDIDSARARPVIPVIMFVFKHVLTLRTPMGRAKRDEALGHGVQLVRNKVEQVEAAGITRLSRIAGVRAGKPVTADGQVLDDVSTVVWCTGSTPDHRWLDLPVFGEDGRPGHWRGVADGEPGLMFLGLDFQFALASSTIQGLDRDARYLLRQIRRHRRTTGAQAPAGPEPLLEATAAG